MFWCLQVGGKSGLWLRAHFLIPLDFLQHVRAAVLAGTGATTEVRTGLWDRIVFTEGPAQLAVDTRRRQQQQQQQRKGPRRGRRRSHGGTDGLTDKQTHQAQDQAQDHGAATTSATSAALASLPRPDLPGGPCGVKKEIVNKFKFLVADFQDLSLRNVAPQ